MEFDDWQDYERNTIVNDQAPDGALESKAPYVDNGTRRVDPSRYYEREFMESEWENMWTKVWLIAGPRSDLRESGDYFRFDIGRESIIVTLDGDSVRAFYNVCPHRGNQLVLNERGCVNQFTCSFHSWQFGLNGCLKKITDQETFRPEVVQHRPGLSKVLCQEHAGLIFVNMNPEAKPLKDCLGLPEGYLEAYNLGAMSAVRHVRSEWAANWKTGVDAFYETYHLHAVHPQTSTVMDDYGTQYDLYPNGASRMIVPLARKSPRVADQDSVDEGLKYMMSDAGMDPDSVTLNATEVRAAIQQFKRDRAQRLSLDYDALSDGQLTDSWATGIFPNVQIGLHPEGAFLMRFLPHPTEPERFYYDTVTLYRHVDDSNYTVPDWMGLPEGTDTTGEDRPDTEHVGLGEQADLGLVLDQDSELLPVVQKGQRSRGFKGPLWSEQEGRLRHFHTELDRYLANQK